MVLTHFLQLSPSDFSVCFIIQQYHFSDKIELYVCVCVCVCVYLNREHLVQKYSLT